MRKNFVKQSRIVVSTRRHRELERELLPNLRCQKKKKKKKKKKRTNSGFTSFLEHIEVLRLLGNQNLGRDRYLQGEIRHEP